MSNAIEKKPDHPVKIGMEKRMPEMIRKMPANMSEAAKQSLAVNTISAVMENEKLRQCSLESIIKAAYTSSFMGLVPNTPTGECFLIPYKTHCNFQLGYQGLLTLLYRAGAVSVTAETVYERDDFRVSLGTHREIIHAPKLGERGKPVAHYAVIETETGGQVFAVISHDDALKHARRFSKPVQGGQSTPWDIEISGETTFFPMCKKTALIQAAKFAPRKTDGGQAQEQLSAAIAADDVVDINAADVVEKSADEKQITKKAAAEVVMPELEEGSLV